MRKSFMAAISVVVALIALAACNNQSGTVDGKSTGKLPAACPIDANRQFTLTIKRSEAASSQFGVCVDEATWSRYNVGDPYP